MALQPEDPQHLLENAAAWMQAILDHCPSNIFLKDAVGRYIFVNRQFEKLFGIDRTHIVGKRSEEVFAEPQAARFQAQDEQVLERGEGAEFEDAAVVRGVQHTAIVQKFPLRDEYGRLYAIGGIATDITDHKAAEEALRESELWCRQLIDAMPVAAYACDREGRIKQFNRAAAALWTHAPEPNAPSEALYDLIVMRRADGTPLEFAGTPMGRAIRGEAVPGETEMILERPDGTRATVVASVALLYGVSGELSGSVNCFQDISERKKSESTLASLSERLINAQEEERKRIARELHDHLAQRLSLLMIGLDNLVQSVQAASPQGAELSELLSLADEIASDLHEISHSLHSTKLEHLGLKAALNDVCLRAAKQHHISVNLQSDDLPGLPADLALCLFRVTQEALNNAVKYSRAAQVTVSLRQRDRLLRLVVEDSGAGFDPEAGSAGLGLASMRERLRMAHGEFAVRSAPGKGTQIVAEIPWTPQAKVKKPKIVLADDHRAMLEEVSRLLEPEAEVVAAVSDGAAAVQAVTENEPDVVVLDIAMPGTGGVEAARQLRAAGYATRIIFLTVQNDPEYERFAEGLAASYVLKGRMRSDLPAALRESLAGRTFRSTREEPKARTAHP